MELSEKEIKKLADLSRLSLSPDEIKRLEKDLGAVIGYIKKIQELKTDFKKINYNSDNNLRSDRVLDRFNLSTPFSNDLPQHDNLLVVPPVFKK